jgi:hypothetical protein
VVRDEDEVGCKAFACFERVQLLGSLEDVLRMKRLAQQFNDVLQRSDHDYFLRSKYYSLELINWL